MCKFSTGGTRIVWRSLVVRIAITWLPIAGPVWAQPTPIVDTQYGPVQGLEEAGVLVFKGIPYGSDTSEVRFKRAKPPTPWIEPLQAIEYPDNSPQKGINAPLFESWIPDPAPADSENMLGLNIWTPGADDHRRPVLVSIHGGGFTEGSGSFLVYQGDKLATQGDIVVVTINHRLGALGYLYLNGLTGEYPDSGNVGNLDIILALEWVHDNIQNFGGDPQRVTIMGESGGGRKVSSLLAMPEAQGLFQRAIIESGSMVRTNTASEAMETTRKLLARLGLEISEIDQLETVPAQTLVDAADEIKDVYWAPVVDGHTLPHHPFDEQAPIESRDIPLLIGTNADEMSIWLEGSGYREIEQDEILGWLRAMIPASMRGTVSDEKLSGIIDSYRGMHPELSAGGLLLKITTDLTYTRNAVHQALLKSRQATAPTWLYRFDWKTPVSDGVYGSPHAVELPFVFNTVDRSASMVGPANNAQSLADKVSEAWINFARFGDPNAPGLPYWPPFSADTRTVMHFADDPYTERDYFKEAEETSKDLPLR